MNNKQLAKHIFPPIISLSVFTLLFLPVEYFLTEKLFLFIKMPDIIGTLFISFTLLFIVFFDKKIILKITKNSKLIILPILIILIGNYTYNSSKSKIESMPRIFRINPSGGIQGQLIKIKGINLMSQGRPGKAYLGSEEISVREWKEKEAVVEQPVMGEFGRKRLFLKRFDGAETNYVIYRVKDPGKIINIKSILKFILNKI